MKAICCLSFAALALSMSPCAALPRTVTGTLLSNPGEVGFIRVSSGRDTYAISPERNAAISRGQAGKHLKSVALRELAPGDKIIAVLNSRGNATSVKAYFGTVRGSLQSVNGGVLRFAGGKSVKLHAGAQVVFASGRVGRTADLRSGQTLVCRTNPQSGEAWSVLVAAASPTRSVALIKSITFSSPEPLKAGNVITVDLVGTPRGSATCEVHGVAPPIRMAEVSPGSYRARINVPKRIAVHGAPVIGRLTAGGSTAPPVQAGRLITITASGHSEPIAPPKPIVVRPPVRPAVSHTVPTTSTSIRITAPRSGARITKALTVKGSAKPGTSVDLSVTYTNGLTGVLKLSGQVVSQTIAVDKRGTFELAPVPLEGPLATRGLVFTIKARYHGQPEAPEVAVKVTGARG